jgi:hypothetical protein
MKGLFASLFALMAFCSAMAGTINVSSPAKGSPTNPTAVRNATTINFSLTAMGKSEARISVTVRRVSDNSIFFQADDATRVQPSTTNDDGSGSYNLTFLEGTPEVTYKVEVRAFPVQAGATTYNIDQDLFVRPDLTKPKILEFSPLSGAYAKGTVTIRVKISEPNLKDWRVQVNNQDIPNNQGTTVNANGEFSVTWDTSGIRFDGQQQVNVRVRDQADNEENINIPVVVDRVAPTVVIQSPQNGAAFGAGSTINVTVDITDFNANSVNSSGVDVVIRDSANRFIGRVSRISFSQNSATGNRWVGRIRWRTGLPSTMKIIVTVVDRAGNRPTTSQTVTVRITP